MSRQAFLTRLRAGLGGMGPAAADEIVADYDAHFAEALAAGRSEAEVAQALGDPARLARELRAEAGLKRWEAERNPSAAAGAVFAVLGLATLDLLVLLPILIGVGGALVGLVAAAVAVFFAGGWVLAAGASGHLPGEVVASPLQAGLAGFGMMAGAVGAAALLGLVVIGLVNALAWYGRLHFRLLKPAAES